MYLIIVIINIQNVTFKFRNLTSYQTGVLAIINLPKETRSFYGNSWLRNPPTTFLVCISVYNNIGGSVAE